MKNNNLDLILGNFIWKVESRQLKRIANNQPSDKESISLTPKQHRLLKYLFDAHPQVRQNHQIIEYVWESKPTSSESLPQLINRTRQAIEDWDKTILINEPGVGYSLNFDIVQVDDHLPSQEEEEEEEKSKMPPLKACRKFINSMGYLPFIVLAIGTGFNAWETAKALYYEANFRNVFQAQPYPDMKTLDNGNILITIDDHACIYDNSELLLQCQ